MGDQCYSTQLIDGDGVLNVEALERFIQAARLPDCGVAYSVVSIMGPQSSGKSTLLNHLFGTNFREMDASRGRSITTKGVWIAKSVRIEPCTIVMDLEGTDGEERGEDDTAFENQSTLFALAISDIVLINMWYHDIGRVHAANQPLLKTVFQVMMRLFRPRKTTLLFVIRDHTKTATPLQLLEPKLKEDIQKIWDTVFKPQTHKGTTLSEFFNVDVTALPSHENEEQFKEQVAQLRQRIFHTVAPGGLAGDRKDVPGSGFSFSAQEIWKVIRENKDLDLPTHNLMVAKVQCEDIANEKLNRLTSDKDWLELKEAFESPVSDFGRKFGSILDKYLSEYDKEAAYFDESVRTAKRQQLESNALNIVHPAFQAMLGHLHSKALDKFKYDLERSLKSGKAFAVSVRDCTQACMLEFDKGFSDVVIKHSDWDASKVQEKLHRDIEAHAISELRAVYEKQLTEALVEHVGSLLEAAGRDTWASIRQLYKRETENAVSGFSASLSGFELDQSTYHKMVADLKEHARSEVERKAKEEARRVLMHMKDRFSAIFSHDKDSQRRKWTGKEDIRRITKQARAAGLMLLSVMAAIRLDNIQDNIENTLKSTLFPKRRSGEGSIDPLASSIWEEVPPENTLITPVQCKLIWEKFVTETADTVIEAEEAQKDYKRNKEDTIRKNTELAVKIASLLIYAVKGLAQVQSQQH